LLPDQWLCIRVGEGLFDDLGILDATDELHRRAERPAGLNVDAESLLKVLRPGARAPVLPAKRVPSAMTAFH